MLKKAEKMRSSLPAQGTSWNKIEAALRGAKSNDYDWKGGRLPLYVYWRDEALYRVAKDAASLFFVENGLGKRAFPSAQQLETDVIDMVLGLMQAGPDAVGNFTSGGTESIFLAAKTARDYALAMRPGISQPKMVLPQSAHPAFDKAAHYLSMTVVRVPLRSDYRADVEGMRDAVDDDAVLLVASAPAYPHGRFDPIDEIAQLGRERDLWVHVDACVGGMLSPFVQRLGYDIPPYDFSVDGVSSISVDLHKYGFCAKGASTLLFRDAELQRFIGFEFNNWPRGKYFTETFLGTRPASPIASAWAVMNFLGEEGYLDIARTTMETKARVQAGIGEIAGLATLEPSELSFLLYYSTDDDLDINAVASGMADLGWFVGRCNAPSAIHLMFNPVHAPVVDEYLQDLKDVVRRVRETGCVGVMDEQTY